MELQTFRSKIRNYVKILRLNLELSLVTVKLHRIKCCTMVRGRSEVRRGGMAQGSRGVAVLVALLAVAVAAQHFAAYAQSVSIFIQAHKNFLFSLVSKY